MTALGREDIEAALAHPDLSRRLVVTPLLDPRQIGRGAIDLRLGTEFLVLRRTRQPHLDPRTDGQQQIDDLHERVVIPYGEQLWLHPQHFVLAATLEFLALPDDISATVVGRSSWGRLGLVVATAVLVHPGFHGCLTLELVNEGDTPIALPPGARIAQLALTRLESPASRDQSADKYSAPVRPQASHLPSERAELERLARLGAALRSRLG